MAFRFGRRVRYRYCMGNRVRAGVRMNLYQQAMMDKPSIVSPWCVFCGRPATEQHHIVYRSQGGANGPTVSVCGFGNAGGCHGLLHAHILHLRWRDGWEWIRTDEPTKYEKALQMDGWKRLEVNGNDWF